MLLDTRNLEADAREMHEALRRREVPRALNIIDRVSPLRTARILSEAPKDTLVPFLVGLDHERAALIIEHCAPVLAAEFLSEIEVDRAGSILAEMQIERVVDLLRHLDNDLREALLAQLDAGFRQEVETLAAFPKGSCGAFMSPYFLAVEESAQVQEVIEAVRNTSHTAERVPYVYVVKENGKLAGVISLRDLITANPTRAVSHVMTTDVVAVRTRDDAEEAARRIRSRHLKMMPVVDDSDILRGVLSIDRAMEIIAAELSDDFVSLNAASPDESFFTPPREAVRKRLPWMAGNVFLNLGAVMVIASFEETLVAVAILAAFLPMITDMGGNVGIQALSVSIRSMALGEARIGDIWKAVNKEVMIGLFNGAALGVLFCVVAYVFEGNLVLALVAGFALGCNVLLAGVVGGTMPFLIRRLGGDPAMMTGPVLTTITDITGVTIYLGLATLFLSGLLIAA
ncbi:MAG: magnesium transporter [Gammaproteobacteria bacterium]|nr:MAG: magnesium transporter [Gammaproteobacteria bacterium]